MDTRNERELTALETFSAAVMVAGTLAIIGALVYRLAVMVIGN